MRKDRSFDSDAFLNDKNFIVSSTSSNIINFHVIVSESSDFSAVTADSEDDENIVFRNILNFS